MWDGCIIKCRCVIIVYVIIINKCDIIIKCVIDNRSLCGCVSCCKVLV